VNWDEIIDTEVDDENWADPKALNNGRSHPADGLENDDSEGEEERRAVRKGLGKGVEQRMGRGKVR